MSPILEVAEKTFSTRDDEVGGCFSVTEIDGGKLIYKAYIVDDETQEIRLVDTYGIIKDEGGKSEESDLDQSLMASIINYPVNFAKAIIDMLKSYIGMLFDLIGM